MQKFTKILILTFTVSAVMYFSACSSGEYETETYTVDYTEKTVKIDTIKKITLNDESIKQDKNNKDNIKDTKESYYYTVQIGAFAMHDNSDRFIEKAKIILGGEVYSEESGNLHKVRVGRFNTRAEAIKYSEMVRSKGYSDAFVVTKKN
ncbi:MAG: SPOR domain-containing protein [Ignavibacteria bacterium]|nr:SPOR domain-containing protein [Ignavibacteria bacterium]